MIELIKGCLIINIIVLVILLVFVIAMGVWHFKKEVAHEKEKGKLREEKDYHCKELEKRCGIENNSNGYDFDSVEEAKKC